MKFKSKKLISKRSKRSKRSKISKISKISKKNKSKISKKGGFRPNFTRQLMLAEDVPELLPGYLQEHEIPEEPTQEFREDLRYKHKINMLCPDTNYCIAFGKQNKEIEDYFQF